MYGAVALDLARAAGHTCLVDFGGTSTRFKLPLWLANRNGYIHYGGCGLSLRLALYNSQGIEWITP